MHPSLYLLIEVKNLLWKSHGSCKRRNSILFSRNCIITQTNTIDSVDLVSGYLDPWKTAYSPSPSLIGDFAASITLHGVCRFWASFLCLGLARPTTFPCLLVKRIIECQSSANSVSFTFFTSLSKYISPSLWKPFSLASKRTMLKIPKIALVS